MKIRKLKSTLSRLAEEFCDSIRSKRTEVPRGPYLRQGGFVNIGSRRSIHDGKKNNPNSPSLDLQFLNDSMVDYRVTCSGGTNGTFIGTDGVMKPQRANLLRWSYDITNAVWSSSGIKTPGQADPNGGTNAWLVTVTAGDAAENLSNTSAIATTTTLTYSVYAKYVSGSNFRSFLLRNSTTSTNFDSLTMNLQTGGISTGVGWTVTSLPNGWFKMTYTRSSGISIGDTISIYAGATGSLTPPAASWLVAFPQLEPGTQSSSYIPTAGSAVFAPRVDSFAAGRTNMVLWSQYGAGNWGFGNTGTASAPVITNNYATAPDGTNTAVRVQLNKGAGTTLTDFAQVNPGLSGTLVNGTNYVMSWYVKATDVTQIGKIVAYRGAAGSTVTLVTLTGSWQRVSAVEVGNSVVTTTGIMLRGTTGSSDIADFLVWGVQLEAGVIPTDYIATTWVPGTVYSVRANLLKNTTFTGAASGAAGTQVYPTSWTDAVAATAGSAFTVNADRSLTFSGDINDRCLMGQLVTLQPNQSLTVSFDVIGMTGGSAPDSISQVVTVSGSVTSDSPSTNVPSTFAVIGRNKYAILAGSAGATVTVRFGVGCGSNLIAAGSVTIANVQVEYGGVSTPYISNSSTTTYASSAPAIGMWVEEARTNSVRNTALAGIVSGSPGTTPNFWTANTTGGSITRTIVGSGVDNNGLTYMDVRWQFSAGASADVRFEATTGVAALNGQTWTASCYAAMVGGSPTNISGLRILMTMFDSGGVSLGSSAVTQYGTPSDLLINNRLVQTFTLNNASTAFAAHMVRITATGVADITIRYAAPQFELGAFASSFIPTLGAATVTRTADSAVMSFPSLNGAAGTWVTDFDTLATSTTANKVILQERAASASDAVQAWVWSGASTSTLSTAYVGAVNKGECTSPGLSAGSMNKVGLSYSGARIVNCLNAGTVSGSVLSGLPVGLGTIEFGAQSGNSQLNGHIRRARYWKTQLPDVTLQALTA